MEEIYPPENFGASERLPLKNYFKEFRESTLFETALPDEDETPDDTEYLLSIRELMENNISFNDLKQLSKACSIDQLTCEGEDTKNFPLDMPTNLNSNSKLPSPFITTDDKTFAVNKYARKYEKPENRLSLCFANRRTYHKNLEFTLPPTPPNLGPGSDFIISVLIHKPITFKFFSAKNASDRLRFNHEIVALGRNTLAELRDTILCSSDMGLCKEVESTDVDLRPLADAKKIYPSGFLFIDDVFYNDFRDPNAVDYSAPIIDWAKQKKISGLQSKSMDDVTIDSLAPRFGYPYLYMHQGDCEHLFVFADARLLDSSDCLHSQCYPHVIKLNRNANKMCLMCTVSFAKWICIGSDRLPQHKVFLCTDCCNSYCYVDGKKLGTFKLYPYYEKHVFT